MAYDMLKVSAGSTDDALGIARLLIQSQSMVVIDEAGADTKVAEPTLEVKKYSRIYVAPATVDMQALLRDAGKLPPDI